MSDKIARLGIDRDPDLMYYIKNDGNVWATPRKQKGQRKGVPKKVAETGLELDYTKYIYFLDSDGDVARKERALGGRKAKSNGKPATRKTPRSSISGHYVTEATAKRHPRTTVTETVGKKSEAELDRDIDECLAMVGKAGYKVSKVSNGTNGVKPAGKPAKKKKRR
jgi:hypothetical protein